MSIRAIIFDRDNTLVRFDPSAIARLETMIAAAAPALPPGAPLAHWQSWPGPWPRTPADEPSFWQAFWRALAEEHGLPPDNAGALERVGSFYHTCFAPFSDTLDCLSALRARGLRLAVLTNYELPSVHLTLRHCGIEPNWFDALISSAMIGCHKPDPHAYLAATAALGLAASECAFVDDLPENVIAAGQLGMCAWLIDRDGAHTGFPSTIHSLAELLAALDTTR